MNYYEYWELDKRPFDNVPDPLMYFDGNPTLDDAVVEILFGIEESEECLIVLVGEIGLGKTLSLRLVLDELDTEKYNIAFINNPAMTFNQLLREIIGQLTGKVCKIRNRDRILEEFNSLLFAEADKHRRVLIFIDEANVLKPTDLQNLRLLTTMQEDDKNLFTLILAGQPILAKRLESREMQNLTQRIGVYCELETLPSCEVVENYINVRLQKAGAKSTIFSEDAIGEIWYTTNGVPRLINRLCNLCLKAGQTHELDMIDDTIVKLVAQRLPEAKSFTASEDQLPKKTAEVLKGERTIDNIKPEDMAKIDISMLSIPEEMRKLAGTLAAERLKREGKGPGTAMGEWNRLRYHIVHELLNA
jgi:general secretion pathway protein A